MDYFEDKGRLQGYEKIKTVGKGAFGTAVLYLRLSDSKEVVIKEINMLEMNAAERKMALNEVDVISSLNHPNIIKYYGNFELDGSLMIEMEYADGGTLMEYLDSKAQLNEELGEYIVLEIFEQITAAIAYMHHHKILHRDLKTANVFLNKNHVAKIGDFGIAKILTSRAQAQTVVGTPYYLSPEMCEGKDYDEKSDVWAMGCILYEMICLRKPFEAPSFPALVSMIMKCEHEPIPDDYSRGLSELVESILQRDSLQRPTALHIHNDILPLLKESVHQEETFKSSITENQLISSPCKTVSRERSVLYYLQAFQDNIDMNPVNLPQKKIINIAVSKTHYIVLTSELLVYTWGEDRMGQQGHGNTNIWRKYPSCVDSLRGKNIVQVAAGNSFSAFLNETGLIMTCGDGRQGCLGHNDWNSLFRPRIIESLLTTNIVQISCGDQHVVALAADGSLYAWGNGQGGRLGTGNEHSCCSPTKINIPKGYKLKSIYCGHDGTMVLAETGQVLACGLNKLNKLGLNSYMRYQEKSLVLTIIKWINHKVKHISMGKHHTAVITEEGNIITFGKNSEAQLGRGHSRVSVYPRVVHIKNRFSFVSCGPTFTVAASTDNIVYFWGTRYRSTLTNSTKTHDTAINALPPEPITRNMFEFSTQSVTSDVFCGDLSANQTSEIVKVPKPVLALYASTSQMGNGHILMLTDIKAVQNGIFATVYTTAPPAGSYKDNKFSSIA